MGEVPHSWDQRVADRISGMAAVLRRRNPRRSSNSALPNNRNAVAAFSPALADAGAATPGDERK
jgi:hypothetical protein